jgi:hypothetical protein
MFPALNIRVDADIVAAVPSKIPLSLLFRDSILLDFVLEPLSSKPGHVVSLLHAFCFLASSNFAPGSLGGGSSSLRKDPVCFPIELSFPFSLKTRSTFQLLRLLSFSRSTFDVLCLLSFSRSTFYFLCLLSFSRAFLKLLGLALIPRSALLSLNTFTLPPLFALPLSFQDLHALNILPPCLIFVASLLFLTPRLIVVLASAFLAAFSVFSTLAVSLLGLVFSEIEADAVAWRALAAG